MKFIANGVKSEADRTFAGGSSRLVGTGIGGGRGVVAPGRTAASASWDCLVNWSVGGVSRGFGRSFFGAETEGNGSWATAVFQRYVFHGGWGGGGEGLFNTR